MSERWVLGRAGIVNVYQYGEETLRFGGGRLLLRGVNGSGKSTAMNMLLPFLLDADARRIDAAGEQSGVLRSWMLSGRDEHQPVGYLWIELSCGSEHLTCGCGIRANRSTDRVSTWWFVTPRRPGIDLSLVENRTPLSVDALRAILGPNAVFAHDQRPAYRAEVRNRLYGGADIDQHVRLLHVVRSPRVGDRIDLDLPGYLEDALPQLSEAALEDAAQPLEDLEEHRRNVEHLTRTAAALDALEAVYRNYARTELHRRATGLLDLVAEHRRCENVERDLHRQQGDAEAERQRLAESVATAEADERRLRQEIATLKSKDAYQAGADLTYLREHVASLDRQLADAEAWVGQTAQREHDARSSLPAARQAVDDDLTSIDRQLTELADLVLTVGLPVRPPGVPRVDIRTSSTDDLQLATAVPDTSTTTRGLAQLRAEARVRVDQIGEVRHGLDAVDRAEQTLRETERRVAEAERAENAALESFSAERAACDDAVEDWRTRVHAWTTRLDQDRLANGLAPVDPALMSVPDLAVAREEIAASLLDTAQGTIDHHARHDAALHARRDSEQSTVDDLAERLAELRAEVLPDPPSLLWQRPERSTCLSELVDFRDGLDAAARAGLEAAMEAAGLLGAELLADGSLRLSEGQLRIDPGKPAPEPLGDLLEVTVPDTLADRVDADVVATVLGAISTRADDLGRGGEWTVVTTDGRFQTGVLRGRHSKPEAEHIGVTARRAALERQRAEATEQLRLASETLAATDAAIDECRRRIDAATGLRRELPSPQPVSAALLRVEHAERQLADRRDQLAARRDEQREAEAAHGAAVDHSRRTAATLGLPHDRVGLDQVDGSLRDVSPRCDLLAQALTTLVRSVDRWIEQGATWERAVDDHNQAEEALRSLRGQREPVAITLATLEDTVGLEYDEIVAALAVSEADLARTGSQLEETRAAHLDAHGATERIASEAAAAALSRQEADARCVAALPRLRDALAVPGLAVAAAASSASVEPADGSDPTEPTELAVRTGGAEPADRTEPADRAEPADSDSPAAALFPVVPETPAGARQLAEAIRARIPAPEQTPTTHDGIRQSLRQRRDALGAGWDAEDHQPDETLPLFVEVTGPLGRMPLPDAARQASAQLRSMSSLLSAKQDQALRNLLQGLIAREVAEKLHSARELVGLMNRRLDSVTTSHGIGVSLRWNRRDDLDSALADTVALLGKPPDLRTTDEDQLLTAALSERLAEARLDDPEAPYRELIARVLDYRLWHRMTLILRRPGRPDERLSRRTALSEGEKKVVSYLPLFAAVAASCDALAETEPAAPRFVLLDDAFAKVSEDNHAKLFGLLVQLDLDFVATSERLWGTHATVPELAITEVVRDADLGVIVLEHSRWDGHERTDMA